MYSGEGVTFDSAGSWSINNDTARNVIIFGVDNSSLSYADNRINNFIVLGKGPIFWINGSFGSPEKNRSIHFRRANPKIFLTLKCNADNNYLFVNGNEIFKFKADNKNVTFPSQVCLRNILSHMLVSLEKCI